MIVLSLKVDDVIKTSKRTCGRLVAEEHCGGRERSSGALIEAGRKLERKVAEGVICRHGKHKAKTYTVCVNGRKSVEVNRRHPKVRKNRLLGGFRQ